MPDEDSLRHKYTPLPEEPRYKKKAKKKHTRSDHKHDYEQVYIDAHTFVHRHGKKVPYLYLGKRCKVCGRLHDWKHTNVSEPPDGMPLYEVPNWSFLWDEKTLPSELEVGNAGKEDA